MYKMKRHKHQTFVLTGVFGDNPFWMLDWLAAVPRVSTGGVGGSSKQLHHRAVAQCHSFHYSSGVRGQRDVAEVTAGVRGQRGVAAATACAAPGRAAAGHGAGGPPASRGCPGYSCADTACPSPSPDLP